MSYAEVRLRAMRPRRNSFPVATADTVDTSAKHSSKQAPLIDNPLADGTQPSTMCPRHIDLRQMLQRRSDSDLPPGQ